MAKRYITPAIATTLMSGVEANVAFFAFWFCAAVLAFVLDTSTGWGNNLDNAFELSARAQVTSLVICAVTAIILGGWIARSGMGHRLAPRALAKRVATSGFYSSVLLAAFALCCLADLYVVLLYLPQ